MIEALYNMLGNAPIVGEPITTAYVAKRIKDSVQKTKDKKLDAETAEMTGDQIDNFIQDKANAIFDDEIGPLIREKNIPDMIVSPLKEKAIEELSGVLKEKLVKKMTTKDEEEEKADAN